MPANWTLYAWRRDTLAKRFQWSGPVTEFAAAGGMPSFRVWPYPDAAGAPLIGLGGTTIVGGEGVRIDGTSALELVVLPGTISTLPAAPYAGGQATFYYELAVGAPTAPRILLLGSIVVTREF